ncbi:nickel ABC transporter permease subunit NikC [Acetobacteraceae bacterium]|nr:nickel ABC transporter permease subunit NikC [Acetobacteraceae bacterium]
MKAASLFYICKRYFLPYFATITLFLFFLSALLGPWLSPYSPTEIDLLHRLAPPNIHHWLGTDLLGRDILSRLIAAARLSLSAVLAALLLILTLGFLIGGSAGFIGGKIDQIFMRLTDICMIFPTFILALFLIGALGTGLSNVILAIALSHWPWYARIIRGFVLSTRHKEFLLSAKMSGASPYQVFKTHLLPMIFSQLIVLASLDVGHILLHVAALSFLGLGVQPPTPEWGVMISEALPYIRTAPFLIFWPGLALFLNIMGFNILGDTLRDHLDPHLPKSGEIP